MKVHLGNEELRADALDWSRDVASEARIHHDRLADGESTFLQADARVLASLTKIEALAKEIAEALRAK